MTPPLMFTSPAPVTCTAPPSPGFPAAGATPARLTFNPDVDFFPVCGPGGGEVVFSSLRAGLPSLFKLALSAPGSETSLTKGKGPLIPTEWSHDGTTVIYSELTSPINWDVKTFSMRDGAQSTLLATEYDERSGRQRGPEPRENLRERGQSR